MKRKVVKITQYGKEINLDIYDFWFVGENYAIAKFKGYGFDILFSSANCYTVETEEIN